jgi:hypothetical protein
VLLLLDSGKFGEVASCAAQSRCRPGFEFDAGNRVDLANHWHTWMQRRRFGALPMRTAYIEKQRPLHPYRNGRIVKSYVAPGVLSPKKLWNAPRADFSLAKVPALAGGSLDTSIIMYWGLWPN